MADTRIIRIGILTSEKVNSLSWGAEVFYRRLMSVVDDFGLYDGHIGVLRGSLYPLQLDKVGNRDIEKWLDECSSAALVTKYASDGKPFLKLENFGQRIRDDCKPKYPMPPDLSPPRPAANGGDPPRPAALANANALTNANAQPQCGDPMVLDAGNRSGWIDWNQIPSSEREKLIGFIRQFGADRAVDILKPVPELCKAKSSVSRARWVIKRFEDIAKRERPRPVCSPLPKAGPKPFFPNKTKQSA